MSDFDYFEDKTGEDADSEKITPEVSQKTDEGEDNESAADKSPMTADAFSGSSFYEPTSEVRERYDEIFDATKPKTVGFSVASMVLGILSVICCCLGWSGLILGTLAIVFSIVSRKVLGYFDGMSIAGLIVGIFGVCFGGLIIFLAYGPIAEMFEEIMKELEASGALDGETPTPSLFGISRGFLGL